MSTMATTTPGSDAIHQDELHLWKDAGTTATASETEATMDLSLTEWSMRSHSNSNNNDCDISGMGMLRRPSQDPPQPACHPGDKEQEEQQSKERLARDMHVTFSDDVTYGDSSPKWGPHEVTDERKTGKDGDTALPLEKEPIPMIQPSDLWWTWEELQQIEQDATWMVQESTHYQEEVIAAVLWHKGFHMAQHLATTIHQEEQLHEILQQDDVVRTHACSLRPWTVVGNTKRGLENLVCRESMIKAAAVRHAILQHQQRQASNDADTSLALHALELTRGARIMARLVGHADRESLQQAWAVEEANHKVAHERRQHRKPEVPSTEFVLMKFEPGPQAFRQRRNGLRTVWKKCTKWFHNSQKMRPPSSQLRASQALQMMEQAEDAHVQNKLLSQWEEAATTSNNASLRTLGKLGYE